MLRVLQMHIASNLAQLVGERFLSDIDYCEVLPPKPNVELIGTLEFEYLRRHHIGNASLTMASFQIVPGKPL